MVTGAGGFIGHHLCRDLASHGHEVTGIDLRFQGGIHEELHQNFSPVVCDFRDESMNRLLKGIEVVFHLASAHLQTGLPDSEYWSINVHALRPLLELSLKSGVANFIHVSSVGVYGDLKAWPANEETPCIPQSIYGETKLAGESEIKRFSRETGIPVTIIRPAWGYGPGCPRTLKIYRALSKGHCVFIGKGWNLRHPIYISDMLDAFRLTMESQAELMETFIIAGERAVTTNELIDTFCRELDVPKPVIRIPYWAGFGIATSSEFLFRLIGKESPISRRSLEFFDTNNAFDISKAKEVLGFHPGYTLADGLRDCQEWLTNNSAK